MHSRKEKRQVKGYEKFQRTCRKKEHVVIKRPCNKKYLQLATSVRASTHMEKVAYVEWKEAKIWKVQRNRQYTVGSFIFDKGIVLK